MEIFSRLFRWHDKEGPAWDAAGQPPTDLHMDAETARAVRDGLDVDAAIAAHQAWSARLYAVIKGTSTEILSMEDVCRDDRCALGRWLHGAGHERLGHFPAFTLLVARHQHFHTEAAHVLDLAQSGEQARAEQKLQSGYRYASTQVVQLLRELRRGADPR